jgi:hypothetical protein
MAEMEQAKKNVEKVCSLEFEGRTRPRHHDQWPAGRRRDLVRMATGATLPPITRV